MAKPEHPQITRLNKLRRQLCWKSPVMAPAFAALQIRQTKIRSTAAVSDRGVMYANVEFFAAKSNPEASFVIIHEAMHLLLRHHERCAGRIPRIWNIAGDLVINEAIPSLFQNPITGLFDTELVRTPSDALWRERDAKWIPPGLTTEATYDHLMKKALEELEKMGNEGASPGAGCGVESDAKLGGEAGDDASGDAGENAEAAGLSPDEWRAIVNLVASNAQAAGNEARALKPLLHRPPARVAWSALLRRMAAQAAAVVGRDFSTWNRRSQRSPARIMLPGTRANETALAVVIDASGSISDDDLSQMVSETQAAVDATSVPAFLVVHDAAVFSSGWIRPSGSHDAVAKHVGGRGGTLFVPAYTRVAAEKKRFSALIHFTDGMPCEPWPGKPVNCRHAVAAITPQGLEETVPDGWRTVPIEGPRKS